jgi:hypothetical protein
MKTICAGFWSLVLAPFDVWKFMVIAELLAPLGWSGKVCAPRLRAALSGAISLTLIGRVTASRLALPARSRKARRELVH